MKDARAALMIQPVNPNDLVPLKDDPDIDAFRDSPELWAALGRAR